MVLKILISTRVVYWNDANGSTFVLAKIGNEIFENHDIIVEDCTVRTYIILRQSFIIAILIASLCLVSSFNCEIARLSKGSKL